MPTTTRPTDLHEALSAAAQELASRTLLAPDLAAEYADKAVRAALRRLWALGWEVPR